MYILIGYVCVSYSTSQQANEEENIPTNITNTAGSRNSHSEKKKKETEQTNH